MFEQSWDGFYVGNIETLVYTDNKVIGSYEGINAGSSGDKVLGTIIGIYI